MDGLWGAERGKRTKDDSWVSWLPVLVEGAEGYSAMKGIQKDD